ncbi:MAG TPA: hypothetical protein VFI17_06270 [Solirubrobacterales bacterium]|nr:hypothetical protein [Solirubrobacterales bacterium]
MNAAHKGRTPGDLDAARILETVEPLCQLSGPSGHEAPVRAHLEQVWTGLGLEPATDRIGNLLARVGGSGPRVLLTAHMDEIGFTVRHITDDGFLFLDSGQGGRRDAPERRFMIGQRANVLGRDQEIVACGAIASPSGHVITPTRLEEPVTLSDVFVDLGAESREEVEASGVHIGSPVVWDAPTRVLGNRLTSKALDDRLLLAVIVLLLETLDLGRLTCELWVGGTVQEENHSHGARAVAAREQFDAVLALDVTLAGDIPAFDRTAVDSRLGQGPVVVHQDHLVAYDQTLAWSVIDAGRAAGVPVQQGSFHNFATDGYAFVDAGLTTVAVGPPARYTHTAIECVDVRDVANTVRLLDAFVTTSQRPDQVQ